MTGLASRGGCNQAMRGCVLTFPACWGQLFLSGGASRTVHSSLLLSGECWWASICLLGGQDKPLNQLAPGNEPGGIDTACSSDCWLLVVTRKSPLWLVMRGPWLWWEGLNDSGLRCELQKNTGNSQTVEQIHCWNVFKPSVCISCLDLGRTFECYVFLVEINFWSEKWVCLRSSISFAYW